jgi:hypothetical protein
VLVAKLLELNLVLSVAEQHFMQHMLMVVAVLLTLRLSTTVLIVDTFLLRTLFVYVAQVLQFQKLAAFVQEDQSTHASIKLVMAYRMVADAVEAALLELDVVDIAAQKYAAVQWLRHGVGGTTRVEPARVKVLVNTEESWKNRNLNYLPVWSMVSTQEHWEFRTACRP